MFHRLVDRRLAWSFRKKLRHENAQASSSSIGMHVALGCSREHSFLLCAVACEI